MGASGPAGGLQVRGVLETCLYADDLAAAERFYTSVIGLAAFSRLDGRHIFFRCGRGMLLVFNPERTGTERMTVGNVGIPLHGARGQGHVAFSIPEGDLPSWREHLTRLAVPVEAEVIWPGGGRSMYLRDPAGNSVELATPRIWGLAEET